MNTYDAVELFCKQLERDIKLSLSKTKIVLTPSSVNDKGLVIKVNIRKTSLDRKGLRSTQKHTRTIRLGLVIDGVAESRTGLKQALEAIEYVDMYLSNVIHLQNENGENIANTRIISTVNPDDSFLDSPDSTDVQDVQDERFITITIPVEQVF